MNKRLLMIGFAIGILLLASIACEASASTASITSATLTADPASGAETTTFTSDQPFYCVVVLANAPDSTKVKAVWYTVDDAGTAGKITENEIVGSGSPINFKATPSNPWPVGNYRVEIYLNDALNKTIDFSVQ